MYSVKAFNADVLVHFSHHLQLDKQARILKSQRIAPFTI